MTVRAIKLAKPLTVDGRLDDEVYQIEQPFGGLLQVVPIYGAQSFYNSGPVHQTLRVTQAMEAGIAEHVWSIEEVVALLG